MTRIQQLHKQRKQILEKLASIEQMRRGSVVEQYLERTRKDGSITKRGPYLLYSFKQKGKTVSRRLSDPKVVQTYQRQIDSFRLFQQLTAQLLAVGEQISDLALSEQEEKKTSKRRSKSKKTPRSFGS